MSSIPRTILAGELTSEHRGLHFRSFTYPSANKTAPQGRRLCTFQADTIHHLKNGAILINGSHPYLRPDSMLTVWDPVAGAPEMVHDGIWRTEEELDALPLLAIITDNDEHGKPHAYQKRWCVVGGQRLNRWFCTTDTDWPESAERLLRNGATYTVLWLPKVTSCAAARR